MTRIFGIDLSHWQKNIDYSKVVNAGGKFSIAKAGEVWINYDGEAHDDVMYERNILEAKKAGLITGAYYFYHPSASSSLQARHFKNVLDKYGYPDLPLVIDIEVNDGIWDKNECARRLKAMIDQLVRETGRKVMIYTNNGKWVNWYGNPSWAHDMPFWIAQYPIIGKIYDYNKYYGKMSGTSAGVNPVMWQFTESMSLPGLPNLDGNFWLGTEQELIEFADGNTNVPDIPDIPDEPLPPEEPEELYIEITANFLRLRHEPSFYSPPTLIVEKGQRLLVLYKGIQGDGIEWYEVAIPDQYGLATGFVSANERYSKRV